MKIIRTHLAIALLAPALEAGAFTVINTNDSGPGSLRAALANAALSPNPGPATITFDAALNGQTIALTTSASDSAFEIAGGEVVTVDASALSAGVKLDGGLQGFRFFMVNTGASLTLHGLTLANGGGAGLIDGGGGIFNQGTLTVNQSTLSGNSADNSISGGGCIFNEGTLTVTHSTLSGNSANNTGGGGGCIFNQGTLTVNQSTLSSNSADNSFYGGGIYNGGTLTVNHSTLSGNSADGSFGGGIFNGGMLTVNQSTLSGNSSDKFSGGGGGIYNEGTLTVNQSTFSGNSSDNTGGGGILNFGTLTVNQSTFSGNSADNSNGGAIYIISSFYNITLTNSLIAGNQALSAPDVFHDGTAISTTGRNFIGNPVGSGLSASSTLLTGNPLLAPLGDYGGPTQTMALMPGSPARNAAIGSSFTSDQRSLPIIDIPDIGAYEAGTINNYLTWSYESLPASATPEQRAATADFDGDGRNHLFEYAVLSSPTTPDSGNPLAFTRNAASTLATIAIPYRPGAPELRYTIERNTDLGSWTIIATIDAATNTITPISGVTRLGTDTNPLSFTDTFINGQPRVFYRMGVQQP